MKRALSRLFGLAPGGAGASAPEIKKRPMPFVAIHHPGRGFFGEKPGPGLIRAGYHRNAIAYRSVRLIAESAAHVTLTLTANGAEVRGHPLEKLLSRPNPREGGAELLEALYGHLMLSGNAYLEALITDGKPRELYALRPDRVSVVAGADGWPEAYDYSAGGGAARIPAGENLLHIRQFDPLDDVIGHAPLAAAQMAIEMHEAASRWNKALLDNSARPSGALIYGSSENLTEEQFDRLRGELEAAFQGTTNAGRPILLEGGLEWRPLSLSPKDMDFGEARNAAAREIALAFGVPPLLLGIAGDNTHSNYAEANRAFFRLTILPLVTRVAGAIAQWMQPHFGEELVLKPDPDAIEALGSEREALWRRVLAADVLNDEEKRNALGYGTEAKRTGMEAS
jgi:HK97 family phage portal protein